MSSRQLDRIRAQAKAMEMSLNEMAHFASEAARLKFEEDGKTLPRTVRELHDYMIDGGRHNLSDGSLRTYRTYWNRLLDELGDEALLNVVASDIRQIARSVKQEVKDEYEQRRKRREAAGEPPPQHRSGNGAMENFIAAARKLFDLALDDGLIRSNPASAKKIDKPDRAKQTSRALEPDQLEELWQAVRTGGDDPELDALIVRTHLETACRAGGLLSLTVDDLMFPNHVRLYEKNETVGDQPVAEELRKALLDHAYRRGADKDGALPGSTPVLHYKRHKDGTPHPMTPKRYETLFGRLRKELPWAKQVWLRSHHLRHTTITAVDRAFGPAVAAAYARHSTKSVTFVYTTAKAKEVRRAHAYLLRQGFGVEPEEDTTESES